MALVVAVWLLVSTVVYAVASLLGLGRLLARTEWVTLPAVRRVIDGVAAGTIVASSLTAAAGSASASTPAAAVAVVTSGDHHTDTTKAMSATERLWAAASAPAGSTERLVTSEPIMATHLPHPGRVAHRLPSPSSTAAAATVSEVGPPSPANGFAGLAPGTKVVVVQPGDCLSVLAQTHLGDWRLDRQIHQLNVGRLQPDGRALVDDHWIYPGWVLVMPADAVDTLIVPARPVPPGAQPTPAQAPPAKRSVSGPAVAPRAGRRHRQSPLAERSRRLPTWLVKPTPTVPGAAAGQGAELLEDADPGAAPKGRERPRRR